jgi:hypothetical protein
MGCWRLISYGVGFVDQFRISGRTRKPWTSKINPVWWFMNDDEQRVEDAPWYRPEWPGWFRFVVWNLLRNPLQNFRAYVVGVSDRNYVVRGRAPVMTVQRNDLVPPEYGYQWCVIELRWLRLPFVSYSGRHVVWYAGWQPSGFFGCKFNLHRSDVSNWERSDGGNHAGDRPE